MVIKDNITVKELVDWVYDELPLGRIASWKSISRYMAGLVALGGTSPHLEIGVLHGGTLIIAALVKKYITGGGKVIGLDPLDGYYPPYALQPDSVKTSAGHVITREKVDKWDNGETAISRETVEKNIAHFGVEGQIEIIQKFSYPWPQELEDRHFGTVYIDGDHYQLGPLVDWVNVHSRMFIGGLVWFDDCNDHCPDVQSAVEIAKRTPGFEVVAHEQNHCFVLRRK